MKTFFLSNKSFKISDSKENKGFKMHKRFFRVCYLKIFITLFFFLQCFKIFSQENKFDNIKIFTTDRFAPHVIFENNKIEGLLGEFVEKSFKQKNISISIVNLPWARAQIEVNSAENKIDPSNTLFCNYQISINKHYVAASKKSSKNFINFVRELTEKFKNSTDFKDLKNRYDFYN